MIKDNFVVLETERLYLKRFKKTDFRNFLNLHQNPITMRYFDGGAKTLEQSKKRFDEVMKHQEKYGFSYYNIFLKSNGEYIGQAGLYYNYDMTVNLCYAFLEQYQKKGYATEAIAEILKQGFNVLKFPVITAMSAPENHNSIHLLEKMGAKFIRERTLFSGMHVLCYSIYKDNFEKALSLIKKENYRKGVGALLINNEGLTYLFQRVDFPESWQSVEGGVDNNEEALEAVYREIKEEIGIDKEKLELITETKNFIKYNFPNNQKRENFIGQEKKFFLFKFSGNVEDFSYKTTNEQQEFQNYKLVSKDKIIDFIPQFKKDLYNSILQEFNNFIK